MRALLDPTAYLPLQVEMGHLPEFLSDLKETLEILAAPEGNVFPCICEDTAVVIMDRHTDLQARGGYYRLCASTLLQVASRHLLTLDHFEQLIDADLAISLPEEVAAEYSRDGFKCFASVAASASPKEEQDLFIVSNRYSQFAVSENAMPLIYLSETADIRTRSIPFLNKRELLFDKYGIVDPSIVETLKVDKPVQVVWEKTGHTPSSRQRRIIEAACQDSGVVLRSATTYHNPHGATDRSVLQLRDVIDEVHFTVCDNGDVLCGVFKTKATTSLEARTCLRLIEHHFNDAIDRF